jgi:hypothetical protein
MKRPLPIIRFLDWLDDRSVRREAQRKRHGQAPTLERFEERISLSTMPITSLASPGGRSVIPADSYVLW